MLQKTRGVVLKRSKYSESSLVVKIYTETHGLQSFLVQSVRTRKSKMKMRLFEAFSVLDFVFYYKEQNSLHRIKEAKSDFLQQSIPFDLAKSSIAMFLSEVLLKSVKDGEADRNLFAMLEHAIRLLDLEEKANPHFHLLFMMKLARYLGFYPDNQVPEHARFFDLNEGIFRSTTPEHSYYVSEQFIPYFRSLLGTNFDTVERLNFPKPIRKLILEKLIIFYQIHTDNLKVIKSHKVLEDIIN